MMSLAELMRVSEMTGFQLEALERVACLFEIQSDRAPAKRQVGIWTKKLIQDCRKLTAKLLSLQSNEMEFLDRLNDAGEIAPELLSDDAAMQAIISAHPALQWKAQNVREYMKSK